MAKLTFFGATEGVTGSAYLLETGQATVLLECGLVQGGREEKKANDKLRKKRKRKASAKNQS